MFSLVTKTSEKCKNVFNDPTETTRELAKVTNLKKSAVFSSSWHMPNRIIPFYSEHIR